MAENTREPGNGEEPLFNIGVVSRMTDIGEAALRVWERRYDFPKSARTAGGHRLYSQQEILRLKWVKMRVDEGMQVSKAIQALNYFEREGGSLSASTLLQPSAPPRAYEDSSLVGYQHRLVDNLIGHSPEGAQQTLADASAIFPLEDVICHVISPAMADIGEAWETGKIDVGTEHFATNLLRHTLLTWMRTGPPAFRVNPVILACAPGELHEGSLLMMGVLLQRLRWPIVYLGQTMPLSALSPLVEALEPSMIIFVAIMDEPAQALLQWPDYLPKAAQTGRPIVGFGGRAFLQHPELAKQMHAVMLGNTLQEGVDTVNRLLHDLNPLLR
jgi:DNA-binding transcriptional MerR regulator